MTLEEAVEIIDAHLHHKWDSLYLMDAWEKVKNELKEKNR